MRKIEQQLAAAVEARRPFHGSNTAVTVTGERTDVYLHGNHIAHREGFGPVIANAETFRKYPTSTTVSRLRAIGVKASRINREPHIDGKAI